MAYLREQRVVQGRCGFGDAPCSTGKVGRPGGVQSGKKGLQKGSQLFWVEGGRPE